jgi:hypothetical protein
MFSSLVSSVLFAGILAQAAPAPVDEKWFQARDSGVSALFEKRQTSPSDPSESSFGLSLMYTVTDDRLCQ